MKREDLTKLELADDVVDKIMALHGQDLEKHKAAAATAQAELGRLKKQIDEANQQIESFKGMDIEGIKAAADEWKTKAEQAKADAEQQIQALKFDHALEQALIGAKARNPKAVKALLQIDALKLNEADGTITGLKEQLEKIQSEADYLFESDTPAPQIVAGGKSKNVLTDPMLLAARRAAGLITEE